MATEVLPARNLLKRWRKKHHVTQADLALKVGVHWTVVSQWEQLRCVPSLQHFWDLHQVTKIPLLDLIRWFLRVPAPVHGDGAVVVDIHSRAVRSRTAVSR